MTQKSFLWTTGGAGDGSSTYTRADWSQILEIVAECHAKEGVGPGYGGIFAASVPSANTVRVLSGGAMVDGKLYVSTGNEDLTIASAVGAGNTRIDRIVLRANWSAQTVRLTVIAGTNAATPVAPSITQISGTTYDLMLYQVTVNTSGVVTISTDERDFAEIPTAGIEDEAITTAKIEDGAITTAKIEDDAVTDAKLRNAAGLSVIGRGANSSGSPTDLVAGSDGYVLRRNGTTLAFGQVAAAGIATGAIETAKIDTDAVDDTKIGNWVPQFRRRQGGSSTDWSDPGSTNYTPGAVRMQAGAASWGGVPAVSGVIYVTLPEAFSYPPVVLVTQEGSLVSVFCKVGIVADDSFRIYWASYSGTYYDSVTVNWLAIGPE